MEVSRLGVESELELPAYPTAAATRDPSHICNLHHSSQGCWILNQLSEGSKWTRTLMDPSRVHYCWAKMGIPYVYLFELVFSFHLDKYPKVELLDHMVVLFLILGGASILFSIVAAPISIPTNSKKHSLFSTPSPRLFISPLLDNSHILTGVRWLLTVVWFAFPWWLVMLSTFSCTYWPSEYFLWKNVYSDPLSIF